MVTELVSLNGKDQTCFPENILHPNQILNMKEMLQLAIESSFTCEFSSIC